MADLISKHGGYKDLKSFQMAEIVFDLTNEFVRLYVDTTYTTNKSNTSYSHNRQADQMLQAARSGSRNIGEGSRTSGTSKQSEIRLVNVARASLDELLDDYIAFLRQNKLNTWPKDDRRVVEIRKLAYQSNRSYMTYKSYLSNAESAANCLITIINQTNYLLDQQLKALEGELKAKGDFSDRIKNYKKDLITGNNYNYNYNYNYNEFLKQQGFKRLENGQVVPLDQEDK